MAIGKCDKCGLKKHVPPYMFGVYLNRNPKTLCESCYKKYCRMMDETVKKFWESEDKNNEIMA